MALQSASRKQDSFMHNMKSMRTTSWCVWIALAIVLQPITAHVCGEESIPAGVTVETVQVYPAKIELKHALDYRQILIYGQTSNGEFVDLTRMAKVTVPSEYVAIDQSGLVTPLADGSGNVEISAAGKSVTLAVSVSGARQNRAVSFVRDVQPALSRMGCNQGTCHGAKDGKDGFKLSLRGYDPLYDHRALTDDFAARRFNRAAPDQSFMLLKATGAIPHVGGVMTNVGDRYYNIVLAWISSGAKLDLDSPRVTSISIFPKNPIVPRAGMKQQMAVYATYSNGEKRDVTREAFIESGNIEVIEADKSGVLTMLRRGEAPVLVRYEGAYAATTLTVMGDRSEFKWAKPATRGYIDELVYLKLQRMKIEPANVCRDEEFVRRIYLDIVGLPPTPKQLLEFLADPRESRVKREHLIDQLVGDGEFIEHWTNKWADLLQVNRKFLGEEGSAALRDWIKQAVATNRPYDQFAHEILTASGSNLDTPPASYFKVLRTPEMLMENTTHLFLAIRFNCNKCHDHPFERWTQDQYYELAAYFAQVGRKEDPDFRGKRIGGSAVEGATPLVEVIYDLGSGDVKHDRTGQISPPKFPFVHAGKIDESATRRQQLAQWLTSVENPYFAKSYVNRLWGYLFGVGIIEPIDDIRAGNPPTNPELLDALTKDFIDSGFDVQHMMRVICKSRTYQHSLKSTRWNDDDNINYSHAFPRRLPAEVLYDAIHLVLGSTPKIPGLPVGFRAAQIPDAGVKVPFLDDFGRPPRESACECERSSGMVLGPIMKLVNGPTVANAIADPNNHLARLIATEKNDPKVVEELFLRFFSRYPTDKEVTIAVEVMQAVGEDLEFAERDLRTYRETLNAAYEDWEAGWNRVTNWEVAHMIEGHSNTGGKFESMEDGSIFVSGPEGKDVYTITFRTEMQGITGIRLAALPDSRLPAGGPGRADNGNFVISELTLDAAPEADSSQFKMLKLQNASATFSQDGWDVKGAIDGNKATGWAVSPQFNKSHTAIFEMSEATAIDGPLLLKLKLDHQFADGKHQLGRLQISLTNSPLPLKPKKIPDAIAPILKVVAAERTAQQKQVLKDFYYSQDPRFVELKRQAEQVKTALKNPRLTGAQDLAWALLNNPAFLFNR
jgi:hypothetical protein